MQYKIDMNKTNDMRTHAVFDSVRIESGKKDSASGSDFICERDLLIRIDGELSGKITCTPVDLEELVTGWMLYEGHIDGFDEIDEMTFSERTDEVPAIVIADVKLNNGMISQIHDRNDIDGTKGVERSKTPADVIAGHDNIIAPEENCERKNCEREICVSPDNKDRSHDAPVPDMKDASGRKAFWRMEDNSTLLEEEKAESSRKTLWTMEDISTLNEEFFNAGYLDSLTRAAHNCMLARHRRDGEGNEAPEHDGAGSIEILYRSEDAGRHSAMDKAIGWASIHGVDMSECMLFTSGRISTRMAEKAGRSGAAVLAGRKTMTAEAVEVSRKYGMGLIGFAASDHFEWFVE